MSRAYRVKVRESVSRTVRAHDRITTQLEILEVLPADQMRGLLAQELRNRGFEERDGVLVRDQHAVTVTVDPQTGSVTVSVEGSEDLTAEGEREGRAYDDLGPSAAQAKKILGEELKKELEQQLERGREKLQNQVTDKLEAELGGLRQELDQTVNRVLAEALKRKAAQLGQIKELTEDPQSGSLTIVVEV